jgi:hypothetical protein
MSTGIRTDTTAADRGSGWRLFAATLIAIAGALNIIYGIAAISDSHFYTRNATYVVGGLNTWGWIILFVGVVQFVAAFGILVRSQVARWAGILTVGGNAIMQLLFIPAYPLLSLTLFAVDILVLYGLLAYGGRRAVA